MCWSHAAATIHAQCIQMRERERESVLELPILCDDPKTARCSPGSPPPPPPFGLACRPPPPKPLLAGEKAPASRLAGTAFSFLSSLPANLLAALAPGKAQTGCCSAGEPAIMGMIPPLPGAPIKSVANVAGSVWPDFCAAVLSWRCRVW